MNEVNAKTHKKTNNTQTHNNISGTKDRVGLGGGLTLRFLFKRTGCLPKDSMKEIQNGIPCS
jgi:hypothetical protein